MSTLPALLQAWAARAPDELALRHKVWGIWVTRSWRELRDEVAALAAGLAALGFEANDRIWIATDVQPEPLLIALAAQWLGGSALVGTGSPPRAGAARFAFVQDALAARAWPPARFVYLDARGEPHGLTYAALREHDPAALSGGPTDQALREHQPGSQSGGRAPAIIVVADSYTSAQLLAPAVAAPPLAEHDAYASGLPLEQQLTTLLPLWLHSGMRLNFAERAATTADADRRELGPSLLMTTPAELERLRQRVAESTAKVPTWLRARARASIRDALGLAHVRTTLVTAPLDRAAADFCAALDLSIHTLQAPVSEPDTAAPALTLEPPRAASLAALPVRTRDTFLRLEHISLAFNEVKAVDDISFGVARHEICALIGPNGAGKSSLLNVINGIYRPSSGAIHFDGQVRTQMSPRAAAQAGIARTFQNLAIFKGMSVLENVIVGRNLSVKSSWLEQALWLGRARASEDASRQRAEEVLAFLRLQQYRHTPAAQLPYGLQKRVELGRALVADPRLLLLDEPMAGMNADEKSDMSEIIRDVNRELGTTVVLIEHDMRVVMDISDHVVVLDYGRLVGDGTPAEVRQNPEVLRAYLGRKRVA